MFTCCKTVKSLLTNIIFTSTMYGWLLVKTRAEGVYIKHDSNNVFSIPYALFSS